MGKRVVLGVEKIDLLCAEILGLKDARQFHAFVSKKRSGLRKRYKVVVEEYVEKDDTSET